MVKKKDIEFSGKVINADTTDKMDFVKADCAMLEEGSYYVVMVDTETLGIGIYVLKLTVQIPDSDYQRGYRKEVININPKIRVTG